MDIGISLYSFIWQSVADRGNCSGVWKEEVEHDGLAAIEGESCATEGENFVFLK